MVMLKQVEGWCIMLIQSDWPLGAGLQLLLLKEWHHPTFIPGQKAQ
jgi:hypothetical protein